MFAIKLGSQVESKTRGFKGIVDARSENLYGCNRYSVSPRVGKDGKMMEGYWFDEMDLIVVSEPKEERTLKNTGGPISRFK